MNIDLTKSELTSLVAEINALLKYEKLSFHQQSKTLTNMSIKGGNGRLNITPTTSGYDIGLGSQSLAKEMFSFMCNLTNKSKNDKFAFPALERSPKWEVGSFSLVKKAVLHYSKTS